MKLPEHYVIKIHNMYVKSHELESILTDAYHHVVLRGDICLVAAREADLELINKQFGSENVEIFSLVLKRVHLNGQNFPEWFILFERELHNIIPYKGDTEEILDMQKVREMFNSGIEAMEAALHLSKELK